MDQILNEPFLKKFLNSIPQKDHYRTIKELLMIGINMVTGSLQESNNQQNILQSHFNCQHGNIIGEIQRIKNRINQIAVMITDDCKPIGLAHSDYQQKPQSLTRSYSHNTGNFTTLGQPLNHKQINNQIQSIKPFQSKDQITPKVTQIIPIGSQSQEIKIRGRTRKHLDDTQLKQAMAYPLSPPRQKKNRFKITENIQMEQQKIKIPIIIEPQDLQHKPIMTGYTSNNVKSKIKALVDRDKQRYHGINHDNQVKIQIYQPQERFHHNHQIQHQSMRNQSHNINTMHETISQNHQIQKIQKMEKNTKDNFRRIYPKHQQIKQSRYDSQDSHSNAIIDDNTSSFSQFSLGSNGRRQIGKISRKK